MKNWKRKMAVAVAFAMTVTSVPAESLVLASEEIVTEAATEAGADAQQPAQEETQAETAAEETNASEAAKAVATEAAAETAAETEETKAPEEETAAETQADGEAVSEAASNAETEAPAREEEELVLEETAAEEPEPATEEAQADPVDAGSVTVTGATIEGVSDTDIVSYKAVDFMRNITVKITYSDGTSEKITQSNWCYSDYDEEDGYVGYNMCIFETKNENKVWMRLYQGETQCDAPYMDYDCGENSWLEAGSYTLKLYVDQEEKATCDFTVALPDASNTTALTDGSSFTISTGTCYRISGLENDQNYILSVEETGDYWSSPYFGTYQEDGTRSDYTYAISGTYILSEEKDYIYYLYLAPLEGEKATVSFAKQKEVTSLSLSLGTTEFVSEEIYGIDATITATFADGSTLTSSYSETSNSGYDIGVGIYDTADGTSSLGSSSLTEGKTYYARAYMYVRNTKSWVYSNAVAVKAVSRKTVASRNAVAGSHVKTTVTVGKGLYAHVAFTPSKTGYYDFSTDSGEMESCTGIYDGKGNYHNSYYLTANTVYYIQIWGYDTMTAAQTTATWTADLEACDTHTKQYRAASAATCGANGAKQAYWYCTTCEGMYSDEAMTKRLYPSDVVIPATGKHSYGAWKTTTAATVFAAGKQTRTCTVCGAKQTRSIAKLTPTITLTASKLTMQTKQKTTAFKVTSMAAGDSVVSVKSSNTKVLKVSNVKATGTFKLTAQKKAGKATLTITLASGLTKKVKVTVKTAKVKTTKITGVEKKVTLKKGKKLKLTPTIVPVTSQDKVTYTSSNKKVATVSSKGVVKAKKKGTATITIKSGSKKKTCKITVK